MISASNIPDGFVEYIDIGSTVRVFVDEKLKRNTIVEKSISNVRNIYKEYKMEMRYIKIMTDELDKYYLDIDRNPLIEKVDNAKEKCKKLIELANSNLSPYMWKVLKYDNKDCLFLIMNNDDET